MFKGSSPRLIHGRCHPEINTMGILLSERSYFSNHRCGEAVWVPRRDVAGVLLSLLYISLSSSGISGALVGHYLALAASKSDSGAPLKINGAIFDDLYLLLNSPESILQFATSTATTYRNI